MVLDVHSVEFFSEIAAGRGDFVRQGKERFCCAAKSIVRHRIASFTLLLLNGLGFA